MYLSHHCRLLNLIDLCMKNIFFSQPPHLTEFLVLPFLVPILTLAGQEYSCVRGSVLRFMRKHVTGKYISPPLISLRLSACLQCHYLEQAWSTWVLARTSIGCQPCVATHQAFDKPVVLQFVWDCDTRQANKALTAHNWINPPCSKAKCNEEDKRTKGTLWETTSFSCAELPLELKSYTAKWLPQQRVFSSSSISMMYSKVAHESKTEMIGAMGALPLSPYFSTCS